jgi:ABC-type multidrug transport system fused ATPase/permease subunit
VVDITIVADIPLFHTVSQTSAAFVAIVAGFYTLKIVTLSNDKRRLLQRINELDNELREKDDYLKSLKEIDSNAVKESDEEIIDEFIEYVKSEFPVYERIYTFEDLRGWYNEHFKPPLTANQERILKEKAPAVLQELEKLRIKRKESSTLKIPKSYSINDISLPTFDRSIDSALAEQLGNQEDINRFYRLRDEIRSTEAKNQGIRKVKEYYETEYNSVAYPKNIKFGFVSLIIFAIIGVIFPLTYEWWVIPLFTNSGYEFNVNLLVVIFLAIGLTLTFLYIAKELYDAISLGNSKDKTEGKTEGKSDTGKEGDRDND